MSKFYKGNCLSIVVLIGDSGTGKTSLIYQYTIGKKPQDSVPTVGVQMSSKVHQLDNQVPVVVQMWDTSGQQRYKAITTQHYKKADGFIILYDITNQQSFNSLDDWIFTAQQFCDNPAKFMILGNKLDKEQERKIQFEQLQRYARKKQIRLYDQISVENKKNMEQAIKKLLQQIHSQKQFNFTPTIIKTKKEPNKNSLCC